MVGYIKQSVGLVNYNYALYQDGLPSTTYSCDVWRELKHLDYLDEDLMFTEAAHEKSIPDR